MRFSLTPALVVALAAQATANSWFGSTGAYSGSPLFSFNLFYPMGVSGYDALHCLSASQYHPTFNEPHTYTTTQSTTSGTRRSLSAG